MRQRRDRRYRRLRSERGEVASWLILAAGLAAATVLAAGIMSSTIIELAQRVGTGAAAEVATLPAGRTGGDRPGGDAGRTDTGQTGDPRETTGTGDPRETGGTGDPRDADTAVASNPDGRGGDPDGRGGDSGPPAPAPDTVDSDADISVNGVDFTVGPYDEPDIHHDNGFLQNRDDPSDPVPLPTREPTEDEQDYYNTELRNANFGDVVNDIPILGRFDDRFNWDNAIPAYRHFLTGDGADTTFDMENYLTHDTNGGIVEGSLIADAQGATTAAIANLTAEGQLDGTGPVTFTVTSDPITTRIGDPVYPYPSSTDWQRTVGGMSMWTTTEVTATPLPDGSVQVEQVTTIHGEDRYNFNPGQAAIDSGEPDSERGVLEESGLAHQYTQTGQTTRTTTWTIDP